MVYDYYSIRNCGPLSRTGLPTEVPPLHPISSRAIDIARWDPALEQIPATNNVQLVAFHGLPDVGIHEKRCMARKHYL